MNAPLDAMLDLAGDHAQRILVDLKRRSMMPTWVLIKEDGNPMIIGTPWRNDRDKERVRKQMRAHMRKLGITAYSFLSEAWTAHVEPHEIDLEKGCILDDARRPYRRADRQEVVIAIAATAENIKWRRWKIVREPTTEIIVRLDLDPFPDSKCEPEGWLGEMLK